MVELGKPVSEIKAHMGGIMAEIEATEKREERYMRLKEGYLQELQKLQEVDSVEGDVELRLVWEKLWLR